MGHEILKKFDRYLLLDMIAQGGMAEVFRARLTTPEGAGRLVILKRILASHSRNSDFVKMFKSETKVMMGLTHPNIVQLYDFGEYEGQPYIAMEFVDGKNLRPFISRYAERKTPLPTDFCVYVAGQVAEGLSYAHNYKDRISGEPLHLVHRDVSPQNIIISYEGNVKVIDFGIAKARTGNGDATRVGIIKGKPSYLSPEQIAGDQLDGRSDVFSLGIVLWESLTGKKLFSPALGENEFAVLKQIESVESHARPPSAVNSAVPKDLDAVVMKALTRKRENRYQSAEEFANSLRRYLVQHSPDYSPKNAAKLAKDLFKQDIVEDRKHLQALVAKSDALIRENPELINQGKDPLLGSAISSGSVEKSEDTGTLEKIELEKVHRNAAMVPTHVKELLAPGRKTRGVTITLNPVTGGSGTGESIHTSSKPPVGLIAALVVAAAIGTFFVPGLLPTEWKELLWSGQRRELGSIRSDAGPQLDGLKTARLRVAVNPGPGTPHFLVRIRGRDYELSTTGALEIPLSEQIEVQATRTGYKPLERILVVSPGQVVDGFFTYVAEMEPNAFGYLTLNSTPSATVEVRSTDSSGVLWTFRTPIEREKLPVGDYAIRIFNVNLGWERSEIIKIKEDKTERMSISLKPDV